MPSFCLFYLMIFDNISPCLATRGEREAAAQVTSNTGENRGQGLHIHEATSRLSLPCELGLVSGLLRPQGGLGPQQG